MRSLSIAILISVLSLAFISPVLGQGARGTPPGGKDALADKEVQETLSAIVRVHMRALDGARSNSTLGAERDGSGVVIDDRGHIVTIGYIVLEADSIEVTTHNNKTIPATLVGYDHATGLGLLHTAVPLSDVTPMPLGSSQALELREPVMVFPFSNGAQIAYVISKRKFSASWEYLLDSAIFTSPPVMQWSGAALVNHEGRLVGIGSLLLREIEAGQQVPGNMFVPVDVLKPILGDLIAKGRRSGPARPWLGIGTEDLQGHLLVTNVSQGGPADRAGIRRGDIVLAVATQPVGNQEDFYRKMWSVGAAGVDVPLRVLQGTELKEIKVHSIDRLQFLKGKPLF